LQDKCFGLPLAKTSEPDTVARLWFEVQKAQLKMARIEVLMASPLEVLALKNRAISLK